MFNLLHSSMNQELFEKHPKSQNSHYEKYRWFPLGHTYLKCYSDLFYNKMGRLVGKKKQLANYNIIEVKIRNFKLD